MNELLEASVRFPTVVFSVGLGIALVYWLFVLLGALDIDLFGDATGAAKGGGEAIGDAITGGTKGGAEALKGVKPDAGHGDGGLLDALGLTSVPITISMSAIFLLGWIGSLLGMYYGQRALGGLGGWLPALCALIVIVLVLPAAGVLVRPLRSVFELKESKRNRDYVGHTCTITTGSVDAGFGQATVEESGGTTLVIPVRCDRPDALGRGARALIIDFDDEREAYIVEPTADLIGPAPGPGEESGSVT